MRNAMAKPKGKNDTPISVNVPLAWVEEAQRLADTMSRPGIEITRADVLRSALRTGLDALGAEHAKPKKR